MNSNKLWLVFDITMLGVVIFNLAWLVFDSLFAVELAYAAITWLLPDSFTDWYGASIHPNFLLIDLVFVAVFITELLFRWIIAVIRKDYQHWAAYPIVHWYDVLGCIPIGELRWLRVLRVFAIIMRLQALKIIDYTQWKLFIFAKKFYDIVLEEISDRVVVKVLEGVQTELEHSQEIEAKIYQRVIQPRQQELNEVIVDKLSDGLQTVYADNGEKLNDYIRNLVSTAVKQNREIRLIDKTPLMGGVVTGMLDHAITDIVINVVKEGIDALSSEEFMRLFGDISESTVAAVLKPSEDQSSILGSAIHETIEVIKDEVREQRWQTT